MGQGAVLAVDAAHHFVHHAAYQVRKGPDGQETAGALSREAAEGGSCWIWTLRVQHGSQEH